jgi:6-phosphogluconolactonase
MTHNMVKLLIVSLFFLLSAMEARAAGTIYAMTNALSSSGGNQVLVFNRANDGTLSLVQTAATGGGGSGLQLSTVDSLGSQSSLVVDGSHQRLFAVNTESLAASSQDCQIGSITSFSIGSDGKLTITDRISSGGMYPDSLTVGTTAAGEVLYVLNAGGPGSPACNQPRLTGVPNISGFMVDAAGKMTFLPDSVQAINPGPLNGTGSGENCPPTGFTPAASFNCGLNPPNFARSPAQVRFSPDNTRLVVTVKGTSSIYVFPVDASGNAGTPAITQAPGPAIPSYFGVTFDKKGHLLVTELFGKSTSIPAGNAGAVSSFTINATGSLTPISMSIGDNGTATCWIALEPTTGKFAYVSNNLSNAISSYTVAADGTLTLLNANAAPAPTSGPNDLVIVGQDGNSSFLYVLDAGDGTVGAFRINLADGSLTSIGAVAGLPVNNGAQGLTGFSQPFPSPLVAAVLPSSRSVQVGGTPATAFATIMNTGTTTASACSIAPGASLPINFDYQTTNPTTNALTGTVDTPVDIAGGGSQSFVFGVTPTAAVSPTQLLLNFSCANALAAPSQIGLNTLLFSASTTPVPDIVALAATMQNDGILHIPGSGGANAFAVATVNVGASTTITATANTGSATLPISLTLCATDQSGNCLATPSPTVTATSNANGTPTFGVFGRATGAIPFNPANSRIFVQFLDPSGTVRGSTSVAVATQ